MFIVSLLAILGYGLLHSLFAALGFKARLRRLMGERAFEGLYRLIYNVISAILLIPITGLLMAGPSTVVWRIATPWSVILMIVQLFGLISLTIAVLQANPLRFAGISQAMAYLNGDPLPLPPEKLQTGGFYSLVRHPLYLFSLLALWPIPTMTDTYLGFAIGATFYFVLGSLMEERKLAHAFPDYHAYRQRVPWLLPWRRPRS